MRFVVTAGPTREAIDPVRFISNRSSGKMGYAIAEAALARGHEVTLISGPASISPPRRAKFIPITTGDELYNAVHRAVRSCDVLVMCAAVSDYKPAAAAARKMKKRKLAFALKLIPTRDILASLPKENRRYLVVGFAAETHDVAANARAKLEAKGVDLLVVNDVSQQGIGFDAEDNEVVLLDRWGGSRALPRMPKADVAEAILSHALMLRATAGTQVPR